jgi:two-component system sensor histidine kinase KdpD
MRPFRSLLRLPEFTRQTWAGLCIALVAYSTLTALLAPFLGERHILPVALLYLLVTLLVAARWGYTVGITGAVLADLLVNFFFVPPVHTFSVQDPENVAALLVFLAVAVVGASMLALLRRQIRISAARTVETSILLDVSQEVARAVSPRDALDRLCRATVHALRAQGCSIVRAEQWQVVGAAGGLAALTREEQAVASEAVRTNTIARVGLARAGHRAARSRDGTAAAVTFVPFGPASPERGVLRLRGPFIPPPLVDMDRLLHAFADEASVAVSRAMLAEEAGRVEALQRADEFKTALLSSVSHDLRTPLTAIKAAVDSLLDATVNWSEEDRASFLATIEGQTDRLTSTIDNLLEMSRLEGGAVRPTIEPVEVEALLNEVRLTTIAATAGREVTVDAPPALWTATDYGLIVQALVNLVENAARYSAPGGAILLLGRQAGGRVLLTVRDGGPGIPSADLPHVFERFYRGSQSLKTRGTGLGLAIVKAMVQLCAGSVYVATNADGNDFVIELPVSPTP